MAGVGGARDGASTRGAAKKTFVHQERGDCVTLLTQASTLHTNVSLASVLLLPSVLLSPENMFRAPAESFGADVMAPAPHTYVDAIRTGLSSSSQDHSQIERTPSSD